MFTIDQLNDFGADTKEGLSRCMGMEALYLRLVGMMEKDTHMAELKAALDKNDLQAAFEAAHALKGVLANLSLTPVLKPISEMTELLRARTDTDYTALYKEAERQMTALISLIQS